MKNKLEEIETPKLTKPEPYQRPLCACCGRDLELRMGWCFDCVGLQSLIIEKKDMWDNDYSDWNKTEILSFIIRKAMRY